MDENLGKSMREFIEAQRKQSQRKQINSPLIMTQRDYDLVKELEPELLEGKNIQIIPFYEPESLSSMEIRYNLPKLEKRTKNRAATKKKYRYKKRK